MITLPETEYIHRDGKTYCTMRQQVLHCIGMNDSCSYGHGPYTRHGRKFYRPWRNYFSTRRNDTIWEPLVAEGLAGKRDYSTKIRTADGDRIIEGCTYWMTRKGLDWLGEQIGVTIHNERD